MKLNGLLEWNTNALTLCQDLRRRTLIHLIDWRVTCWSLGLLSATLLSLCECSKLPKLPVLHLHWRRLPRLRKVYFSQGLLYDVEDILAGVLHICQQSNFPELWLMEGLPVTRAGRTNALYWMSPPSPLHFYRSTIQPTAYLILTLCWILQHDWSSLLDCWIVQASFQQRCERSDKLKVLLTTGRWFAITPTGPSTERWDLKCNQISHHDGNPDNSEKVKTLTR